MKKFLGLSSVICLVFLSFHYANAQLSALTDEQREAAAVIELFINAQAEGNTEVIKETLGGDLLKKRLKLLDNPDYPSFLRDVYKGCSFEILNYKSLKKDSMQIDVIIDIDEQESQKIRFLLIKTSTSSDTPPQFRIYSQTELTKTSLNNNE
jgi:hypothetical protein